MLFSPPPRIYFRHFTYDNWSQSENGNYMKYMQTFQFSGNRLENPTFLFAFTYHAWSDLLPAFLKLNKVAIQPVWIMIVLFVSVYLIRFFNS